MASQPSEKLARWRWWLWVGIASQAAILPSAAIELTIAEENGLRAAKQGAVVMLEDFLRTRAELPLVPIQITDDHGPQFLLSDLPEYFLTGDGIALQEEVKPGLVRLYLYHVPEPAAAGKTISAVIENLGNQAMELRFIHYAFPAPSADYQRTAKRALMEFFTSQPEKSGRRILPGIRATLDPKMDKVVVTRDQLVHGFYEFEVDQPARITVFQRDPNQASLGIIDKLPKLPRAAPGKTKGSGAGRGLFPSGNFSVTNNPGYVLDTANGAMQLIVADGKQDPWIRGRDGLDGAETRDAGNYGVLYRIRVTRASSDGRGLALLMCKIGANSRWCGKLAAAVQVSGGVWKSGAVALPAEQPSFGASGEAALIQKFAPLPKGQTETIEVIYSPPGAACIPTPLVFVPYRP